MIKSVLALTIMVAGSYAMEPPEGGEVTKLQPVPVMVFQNNIDSMTPGFLIVDLLRCFITECNLNQASPSELEILSAPNSILPHNITNMAWQRVPNATENEMRRAIKCIYDTIKNPSIEISCATNTLSQEESASNYPEGLFEDSTEESDDACHTECTLF